MKNNIRILLLILTVLFIATALTIRNTVTEKDILERDTYYLTKNLTKKENIIEQIFNDSTLLKTFANSERYPLQLQEIANNYIKDHIYLYIYKNNKPIFWSTNIYVPNNVGIVPERSSFIHDDNYAFVTKVAELKNNIKILALIPIEKNYIGAKDYKKNELYEYLDAENLKIADFKENKNIRNIYSKDKTLLFSVTLKEGKYNNVYTKLQLLCWVLSAICLIISITGYCFNLAKNKQKPIKSIVLLTLTITILRVLDLESNLISSLSDLNIFLPSHYSFNYFTPNIWALLINSLGIFWIIAYIVYIKKYIIVSIRIKKTGTLIFVYYLLISFLYIFYNYIFAQLATLITHSSDYQDDIAQFIYSNKLTLTHVFIYSISILSIILITDFILEIVERFNLNKITSLNIQLIVLVQFVIIFALQDQFSLITILIAILIIIRPYDKIVFQEKNKSIHIITLIILSLITNIKFSDANKTTMIEQMKLKILAIQSDDDLLAINTFSEIEQKITKDEQIKKLLELKNNAKKEEIITEYIKIKYLKGYISKYNFKGYYFEDNKPLGEYNADVIDFFREKVISQSLKVKETELFYKSQKSGIGIYEYFTIINIPLSKENNATIILDFTNTNHDELIYSLDNNKSNVSKIKSSEDISFAIYRNGILSSQKGKYIYSNKDNQIPTETGKFTTYESTDGYFHLIYKNSQNETIVVSKHNQSYWQFITIASVVFLLLYALSIVTSFLMYIIPRYLNKKIKIRYINYQIRDLFNTIRYSTRIQTLVISSVVIVIIISGLITYFSVDKQSQAIREQNRLKNITEIAGKLELKILTNGSNINIDYLASILNNFTDLLTTDFNLYDKNGKLYYTTQPQIYEQGLISEYINPNALIELNILKKVETQNIESLDDFNYESVYATIKNDKYNTIGYLNIPYYNSQEIEDDSRDILLNSIFNIYTIIIIFFAFMSIFIANKITEPLKLIRKKLTTTNLNEKFNEPLYWEKNDEIGLLIKDYNYMLIKLEENAKQLRNAERESAWREMAKQIAHEIKNPLTPMKLGIQQLSRLFHENDPRLNERFDKISTSFVEQIDALAHIANEFSAFAKLPETNLAPLDVNQEIIQSIELYRNSKNTIIEFLNKTGIDSITILADKEQALRAFNNLLKNAIESKSKNKKQKITISLELIESEWIKISVKDQGDGIPYEFRKNIFKPNFTTKSSGTGLGLAFVKQTVDGMGGRIYFESIINIGTTFFIELPVYKENKNT